jgi:PAS domain S-box-containing protein
VRIVVLDDDAGARKAVATRLRQEWGEIEILEAEQRYRIQSMQLLGELNRVNRRLHDESCKRRELERDLADAHAALERLALAQASELEATDARFRAIFDLTFEFIGLLTPDGTVLEVNEPALRFAGLMRAEVVGRPFWEARWWTISPETQAQVREAIETAAQGESVRYVAGVRGIDDQIVTIDFYIKPVRDSEGRIIYLLPEGHDITEIKHAEEAQRRYAEQLRVLSQRLVQVQEDERRAIARELHDEAGQALTALKVGLELLERDAGRPASVVARSRELNNTVDQVMENLHRLSMNLRPASLDRVGLVPALAQYIESFRQMNGLPVEFLPVGLDGAHLSPDVEITLYRVVQEALTNVVRHAQATRVSIVLQRKLGVVAGIIEDNGQGFDVDLALQGGRLGLFGMQERAEMLGGRLVVESTIGQGTTVFVELPAD